MNINTPDQLKNVLLKAHKQNKKDLLFGYDGEYYWEQWYLHPLSDVVLVIVRIGSGSGWIETANDIKEMTYQELFDLLKNKLFENEEASLMDILENTLDADFLRNRLPHRRVTGYDNVEVDIDDLLNLIGV